MDFDPSPHLAGFPVSIVLPLQWGDQDAFGHVNNTVYLRWFESARISYSTRVGLSRMMADEKIGPILASLTCNYRRQLVFPDTVHIGARITRIGRSSLTMEHLVVSEALGATAADGHSVIVVYDYQANRSRVVPDPIRAEIEALEGKTWPRPD